MRLRCCLLMLMCLPVMASPVTKIVTNDFFSLSIYPEPAYAIDVGASMTIEVLSPTATFNLYMTARFPSMTQCTPVYDWNWYTSNCTGYGMGEASFAGHVYDWGGSYDYYLDWSQLWPIWIRGCYDCEIELERGTYTAYLSVYGYEYGQDLAPLDPGSAYIELRLLQGRAIDPTAAPEPATVLLTALPLFGWATWKAYSRWHPGRGIASRQYVLE